MNHYPRHVGDFIKDTVGLSLAERGAYTALLDQYYASEKPIQHSERYRLTGAVSKADRAAVDYIMGRYFVEQADGWHQKRADKEITHYRDKAAKAAASGVRSGEARRESRDQINRKLRAERMAAAKMKGTHTAEEWAALVDVCGGACVSCGAVGSVVRDHIVPVYQGGSDDIGNLQPLCVSCNSSKGPADFDHRPVGWRETFDERLLNGRSTSHKPVTSNQKPESKARAARASARPSLESPTVEHERIAAEVGVSCQAEFSKYRDWMAANGRRQKDEAAGFRNWLRRAGEYRRSSVVGAGSIHDKRAATAAAMYGTTTTGASLEPHDITAEAQRVA